LKIAFFDYVCNPAKPGASGLSDIVWNMAAGLRDLGDEVHIVAPYTVTSYPDGGVHIHRFPVPPMGYRNIVGHALIVLRGWLELRKLNEVDVIHAPEYFSTGILSLLIRDVPIVLTAPGNIYEKIDSGSNPFDWSVTVALKMTARLSSRRCARINVITQDMIQWWERTGAAPSKVVWIPHGVNTKLFRPIPNARQYLNLDPKARIILYVGHIHRMKGLSYLFQAVRLLRDEVNNVQVHLVGEGSERSRLEMLAKELGIEHMVTWHGWVDVQKLPFYYSTADVVVLPSLGEGLPRVMLEAMACGIPFIGTTVGGIVDHIRTGETGILIHPGEVDSLVHALGLVLTDQALNSRIARNGYIYVHKEMDWAVIVKRLREQLFTQIAGIS